MACSRLLGKSCGFSNGKYLFAIVRAQPRHCSYTKRCATYEKRMKTLIYTILFLTFNQSFAQKTLSYQNVLAELENSSESLNTTLISPKSDFYIGITKGAIVENPELNSCIDIKTNEKKNGQIITILKKYNLLDKLYVEINNEYSDLSSDQIFKPTQTELYLELFFKTVFIVKYFVQIAD